MPSLTTWNDHMDDYDYFLYRLNKCLASPLIEASENQQLTQLVHQLIQANEQGLIVQLASKLKQLLRRVEIRIETALHVQAIIDCHLKYNSKPLAMNTPKIGTV